MRKKNHACSSFLEHDINSFPTLSPYRCRMDPYTGTFYVASRSPSGPKGILSLFSPVRGESAVLSAKASFNASCNCGDLDVSAFDLVPSELGDGRVARLVLSDASEGGLFFAEEDFCECRRKVKYHLKSNFVLIITTHLFFPRLPKGGDGRTTLMTSDLSYVYGSSVSFGTAGKLFATNLKTLHRKELELPSPLPVSAWKATAKCGACQRIPRDTVLSCLVPNVNASALEVLEAAVDEVKLRLPSFPDRNDVGGGLCPTSFSFPPLLYK